LTEALVFDTGPLSHFAEAGWLKILEALAGDRPVLIPEVVRVEIAEATYIHPFLDQVLEADWIKTDRSDDVELLVAQARYTRRLAIGTKNLGECGVLALAEVRQHVAIVDDRVAREVGKEYNVQIKGTLALLCEGVRHGLLTVPLVSKIADDLLATEYRLPVRPGQFEAWAGEQGLI
jgi:predicted nucleic acid-binding protein